MNFSQDEQAAAAGADSMESAPDSSHDRMDRPPQAEQAEAIVPDFDMEDFDDEFDDDFEAEVDGEYELEDDEYAEQLAEMLDVDIESFAEFVDEDSETSDESKLDGTDRDTT